MTPAPTLTTLLRDWRSGDADALQQLAPLVYDDLHRIAARYLQAERPGHTLQATGLIHEAFSRLAEADIPWQDRAHFFAVAARQMRRILMDYGRARGSEKRGGGMEAVTLHEDQVAGRDRTQLTDLDEALHKLARLDPRKSDILVLHYFGGMTYDEMAEALGISPATVDRDLRFAKTWLANELDGD